MTFSASERPCSDFYKIFFIYELSELSTDPALKSLGLYMVLKVLVDAKCCDLTERRQVCSFLYIIL